MSRQEENSIINKLYSFARNLIKEKDYSDDELKSGMDLIFLEYGNISTKDLQILFYRFIHPIKKEYELRRGDEPDEIERLEEIKAKIAIEILLPKLFYPEFNRLISSENLSFKDELIWSREFKGGEKGGGNVISCLFSWIENTHYGRNKIKLDLFPLFFGKEKSGFDDNSANELSKSLMSILKHQDKKGFTPLINACSHSSCGSVERIFDAVGKHIKEEERNEFVKEILRQSDEKGFTPLISACSNKSFESVEKIFEAVAKYIKEEERKEFVKELLWQRNERGFAPLVSAYSKNDPNSVEKIFEAVGKCIKKEERNEFVKELLRQSDERKFTPLLDSCANKSFNSVEKIFEAVGKYIKEEERSEFVKELLRQGDEKGFTPLISACSKKDHNSVKKIFEAVEKYIKEEERGEFVKELLRQRNKEGFTPLINSCAKSDFDSIKEMLAAVIKYVKADEKAAFMKEVFECRSVKNWSAIGNLRRNYYSNAKIDVINYLEGCQIDLATQIGFKVEEINSAQIQKQLKLAMEEQGARRERSEVKKINSTPHEQARVGNHNWQFRRPYANNEMSRHNNYGHGSNRANYVLNPSKSLSSNREGYEKLDESSSKRHK